MTIGLATLWITRKSFPDSPPECFLAWDEFSIEENWEGWRDAVDKALASLKDDLAEYRFFNLSLPAELINRAFAMQSIDVQNVTRLDDPRSL